MYLLVNNDKYMNTW